MSERWREVARRQAGPAYAATYAERFRAMAASGQDVHGEATFVTGLVAPPARVLDAGCGTGRVAVRLAGLGYDVVGVDADETMLAVAREEAPDIAWHEADLARLDLGTAFDLVLLAGNIVPLLDPGTLSATCARLAAHLAPGGIVVCGFGLDPGHLPAGCPVTPLADFDDAMAAAGLAVVERWSGWDGTAFDAAGGYVVTVHAEAAAEGERGAGR